MSLIPINDLGRISSKRTLSLKKRENILEFLPHDEKGLYLPVLGLALKEVISDEGSWINFRKGEFVYGKETQALRRRIFILGGLVFIILSSGLLDLYIHFHMKDSRHQSLKEDLSQTYMAMFPGAKNVVDEVQQTRSALEEMKKKITKIGTGQVTPLQILAELTSRIPEEADIEVYDLSIDQSKVRMEAEAASFDSIDSIKRSFLKVKEVKEVVVSDARVSAEKDRVKFRVTLEWREGI
jgi:type II secretory pathway component PulL